MTDTFSPAEVSHLLRGLRQRRTFTNEPIADDVLQDILEVARWTGSAKNSQPWHLIVVRDKAMLEQLSTSGQFAGFLKGVDVAIVIALHGYARVAEVYDEGRLSERIMLIADTYGLGSGTGWFSDEAGQAKVKELLNIPGEWFVHSAVGLGHVPDGYTSPTGITLGRRELSEIVSYERVSDSVRKD
ncbi:MAG: nitroreductase family protein [Thermomicrobiales bacterium]